MYVHARGRYDLYRVRLYIDGEAATNDRIRCQLRRIPRLFSLGGAYLTQRSDVDSSRIAMVVTSFAVPFGVLAAAEDRRFRNVGLIYGAGDLGKVLEANLSLASGLLRRVAVWLARELYHEFEPTHRVAAIAPRPLIMVNGRDASDACRGGMGAV